VLRIFEIVICFRSVLDYAFGLASRLVGVAGLGGGQGNEMGSVL
jgi:hypothetical protein